MLFTKFMGAPRKVIHRRLRGAIPKALLAADEQLWSSYKAMPKSPCQRSFKKPNNASLWTSNLSRHR